MEKKKETLAKIEDFNIRIFYGIESITKISATSATSATSARFRRDMKRACKNHKEWKPKHP